MEDVEENMQHTTNQLVYTLDADYVDGTYRRGHFRDYNRHFYAVDWRSLDPDLHHHTFHWGNDDPAYLSIFFPDMKSNLLLFEPFVDKFSDTLYKHGFPVGNIAIPLPNGHNGPEDTVTHISEKFKGYIKHWIDYLGRLHHANTYTMGIRITNLVMCKDKPSFHILGLQTLDLEQLSRDGMDATDFKQLKNGRAGSITSFCGLLSMKFLSIMILLQTSITSWDYWKMHPLKTLLDCCLIMLLL